MPATMGPRQRTDWPSSMRKPSDIRWMPKRMIGTILPSRVKGFSFTAPIISGIDGP